MAQSLVPAAAGIQDADEVKFLRLMFRWAFAQATNPGAVTLVSIAVPPAGGDESTIGAPAASQTKWLVPPPRSQPASNGGGGWPR